MGNDRRNAPANMRDRIRAGQVFGKVLAFADGTISDPDHENYDAHYTAANAAIGLRLINKVVPDLRQVNVSGKIEHSLSREELEGRLLQHGVDPKTLKLVSTG